MGQIKTEKRTLRVKIIILILTVWAAIRQDMDRINESRRVIKEKYPTAYSVGRIFAILLKWFIYIVIVLVAITLFIAMVGAIFGF